MTSRAWKSRSSVIEGSLAVISENARAEMIEAVLGVPDLRIGDDDLLARRYIKRHAN